MCEPQPWVVAGIELLVLYCENEFLVSSKNVLHGRYRVA